MSSRRRRRPLFSTNYITFYSAPSVEEDSREWLEAPRFEAFSSLICLSIKNHRTILETQEGACKRLMVYRMWRRAVDDYIEPPSDPFETSILPIKSLHFIEGTPLA